MILVVLAGNNILGIFKLAPAPNSQALKNLELSEPSLEVFKNEPWKDNSNISAPLNTFLLNNENLPRIPNGLILEVVNSVSKPKEYFFKGVK